MIACTRRRGVALSRGSAAVCGSPCMPWFFGYFSCRSTLKSSGRQLAPIRLERRALDQFSGQRMTDDLLGLACRLDQPIQIDPGLDAEFKAHVHEVLGRYVAGRALEPA